MFAEWRNSLAHGVEMQIWGDGSMLHGQGGTNQTG
jgi:hypothetical protein